MLAKGKWILIYDNGYRYLVSIAGDHYERLEIISVISENSGIARDVNTGKYYEYNNESGSLFLKESFIPSD